MIFSSVLDTQTIDEQQVQSFFSRLTLEKLLYAAVLLVLCAVLIRLILRAADKLFSRSKLDHTIFGFLRTSAKAILSSSPSCSWRGRSASIPRLCSPS